MTVDEPVTPTRIIPADQPVPPPPDYPPTVGSPAPDWWEDLDRNEEPFAARPAAPRLPWWWEPKPLLASASGTEADVDPGESEEPLAAPAAEEPGSEDDPLEPSQPGTWFVSDPGYYPALPAPRPPAALNPKTRAALYNAAAAGTGYAFGLTPMLGGAITAVGHSSISGALVLGGGTCLFTAHFWDRRTRHWWPPIAWAARVPLASAVLALALYAPASHI
ncbi:hypothetical protein [Streptomyces sp. NPDC051173]|uniref:hypothetical protein n=1 Tax=Streptomyces sp. NPDC051173 TaxID=3155164 RepID=UPI00344FCBF4